MVAKLGRRCTSVSQQLRARWLYSAGTPLGKAGRLCFLYTLQWDGGGGQEGAHSNGQQHVLMWESTACHNGYTGMESVGMRGPSAAAHTPRQLTKDRKRPQQLTTS